MGDILAGIIAAIIVALPTILFCFIAGFCVSGLLIVIFALIKLGDKVRAFFAGIGKGDKSIDGKAIGSAIRKVSFGVGGFATDIVKGVFDIKDDGSKVAAPAVTSTVETPAPVAEVKVVTPVVTGADEL